MNKDKWNEIARKTKWASGKRRLGKRALCELQTHALDLDAFMNKNKSEYGNVSRKEVFKRTHGKI